MKKKLVTRLLKGVLVGVMSLSLLACGKSASNSSTNTNEPNAAEEKSNETEEKNDADSGGNYAGTTLTIGIWGGNDAESSAIEQVKKDFEAKTGATVEFKVYTDYNTQIQADFIGKTAPDVFYVDANVFPFYSGLGVMEELDPTEMGAGSFYQNLLDAFTTQDGKLLAMPKDVSTLALYYNEDMLEACGMTADDIPEKLEEYVTFLPAFQAKLDDVYGKGQVCAMTWNMELPRNLHLLERDGAEVCTEDGTATLSNDKIIENIEFILSLVDTGAYKTPKDLGLGWNGEVFGTEKCAIMEEGNWVYGNLVQNYPDIKFGVKDMPSYKGAKSSMSFTVGYGIYSGSGNKELAKEWVKYACGVDGMSTWCQGAGTLPSRADVADAINVESDPLLAVHLSQIEYAVPWQKGTTITIINDNYQNFLPGAIKKETTVKEAMEKADKQANSEIQNAM